MKIIQSFHISHCQFPLLLVSYMNIVFIIISELMLPLIKVHPLFRFCEFLPKVLFLVLDLIQETTLRLLALVFLGSPWLWQFLRLALFLVTLAVLQNFVGWTQDGICLMFFSLFDWNDGFGGRSTKVECRSHPIRERVHGLNMTFHW